MTKCKNCGYEFEHPAYVDSLALTTNNTQPLIWTETAEGTTSLPASTTYSANTNIASTVMLRPCCPKCNVLISD